MYRESINPTSIPLPPVWQPHPALRLLNQTIALVASFDLPPAQFTALLDSIMSVHDLIAIEDEVGARDSALVGSRNSSVYSAHPAVSFGWQAGWHMSKAAEAAPAPAPVPSGEDSRGASGWKDDWNWKADTEPTVESLLDAGLREAWRDSESVDEEVETGDKETVFGVSPRTSISSASTATDARRFEQVLDAEGGESITFLTWDQEQYKTSSPPVDADDDFLFRATVMTPIPEERSELEVEDVAPPAPTDRNVPQSPSLSACGVRTSAIPFSANMSRSSSGTKLVRARQPMSEDMTNRDKPLPAPVARYAPTVADEKFDPSCINVASPGRPLTQLFEGFKAAVSRSPVLHK